jgi:multisubunit Na+/H+ antiporter MnhG subunit
MQEDEESTDWPATLDEAVVSEMPEESETPAEDQGESNSEETSASSSSIDTTSTHATSPAVAGFAAPVMVGSVGSPLAQPQPYGQVLMVGPPSGAAKIIGIFIIIWGAIGLFDVSSFFTMPMTPSFTILTLFNLVVSGGFIYAGIKVHSYKKWAIHMTWILLVLWVVATIASVMLLPDMYAQMVEDGEMTEEQFDLLTGELATGVGIGVSVFCGGICALMVAIPMMVANNGLDNSSLLFRSGKPGLDGEEQKIYPTGEE